MVPQVKSGGGGEGGGRGGRVSSHIHSDSLRITLGQNIAFCGVYKWVGLEICLVVAEIPYLNL